MPKRTFTEARRMIARADDDPKLLAEFDQRATEAAERLRQLQAPQRQKAENELAKLAQAAERNRDALRAAAEDLTKKRISRAAFNRKRDRLAQDQRVVVAKAGRVRERLTVLDDREANAPQAMDRIAQTTGLGKTEFSF